MEGLTDGSATQLVNDCVLAHTTGAKDAHDFTWRQVDEQARRLASALLALGWQAGGAVAVRPDDPKGVQALDPFFELYAWFEPPADDVKTLDGMTGWLRIPLPSKPLAMQATRSMQQLLQKRFSL